MEAIKTNSMKKILAKILSPQPVVSDCGMLLLRVAVSLEIAIVHGFKKNWRWRITG